MITSIGGHALARDRVIVPGATWLDSTIAGLGRGAGNCPTELLIGFLKNPKFHLRPVLE